MRRQNYQGMRRVDERPHPDMWGEDEAMTYREAERLLMPHGPLTHRSLRAAAEKGRLAFTDVNGRRFTTKAAVRDLMVARIRPEGPLPAMGAGEPEEDGPPPSGAPAPRGREALSLRASAFAESLGRRPNGSRAR